MTPASTSTRQVARITARVTFKHAYNAAGTFTVRAVVTDAIYGDKEATKSIVVN